MRYTSASACYHVGAVSMCGDAACVLATYNFVLSAVIASLSASARSCLFLQFVGPKGADAFADRWLWGAAPQYLFLNEHALKVRRYIKQAHITLWRFHPPLAVLGVHAVVEQVRYRVARLDPRCFGGGGELGLDVAGD